MSVQADVSVSATDFLLGGVLTGETDYQFRMERVVPFGTSVVPFLRASGADLDGIEPVLRSARDVSEVETIDTDDHEELVRIEWTPDVESRIEWVTDSDAVLLDAVGVEDSWSLEVRFRDRGDLSEFYRRSIDHDVSLSVERIHNPGSSGAGDDPLTDVQRETLHAALESGYFEVPRETSLAALADEFEVSDTAISLRLRRGVSNLVGAFVVPSTARPNDDR